MADDIEGLGDVLKNMDDAGELILDATEVGMDIELRRTVNHIKNEYDRQKTGKGFTDSRNSIDSDTEREKKEVVGYVHVGTPYSPHLELRMSGMYAFLWPGTNDRAQDIKDGIAKNVRLITGR
jgi:hypothetical protein